MKVRYPKIDFSQVSPHWAPHVEFVQRANASSVIPSFVEPYLVKVMLKARAVLDRNRTRLHDELAVFIKQEAQHCKQHDAFNARLRDGGYPGLAAFEHRLESDLEGFLENRSLKFNLAYADGFEALGALGAQMWFDCYVEYLDGADPNAVDLWKWHMAEEFEHRTVAFDVYHALYGHRNWFDGYVYRVYGFLFAARHLIGFGREVGDYLLGVDRDAMSPAERQASLAREAAFKKKLSKVLLPELLKVLSPFYNPARRVAPAGLDEYLARWDAPARA